MSFAKVIEALSIPLNARVDKRVPKKKLMEQSIPTPGDKKQIQDGIDETIWIAALKPNNISIPIFRDNVREYLEIIILTTKLRETAKATRLIELIHRAIPYPVVLITEQRCTVSLSLSHKRWSLGEKDKIVIEDLRITAPFQPECPTAAEAAFLSSMALSGLPRRDLFLLYQGWLDRLAALEASEITGVFKLPISIDRSSALRENLDNHSRLEHDIIILRSLAEKETQISRRVELNLEIKQREDEISTVLQIIKLE
jgi:hypothetical protein